MPARSALLVSVLAAALLSGCSGSDAAPRVLPPVTASPTSSPVPMASVPAAARAHTPQGAAAFVRFYFSLVNEAFTTGHAGQLPELSDPECGACRNLIATAQQFAKDRQHIRGIAVRVLSAEAPPEQNGYIAVDAFFDAPARAIVTNDGALVRSLAPEAAYHRTVFVKRTVSGWLVRAVQTARVNS